MNVEWHHAAVDPQTNPPDLAVSPPVGSYRLQPPSPYIIITQPKGRYLFTIPRRDELTYAVRTVGRVSTAHAKSCKSQRFLR